MNRHLTSALLATALLVFGGCHATKSPPPGQAPTPATIAGGWTQASVMEPSVHAAAQEAVALQAKATGEELTLEKVLSAQTQVVAGTNYRLTLSVKKSGKKKTASIVIWEKLDGTHDLSSWNWD